MTRNWNTNYLGDHEYFEWQIGCLISITKQHRSRLVIQKFSWNCYNVLFDLICIEFDLILIMLIIVLFILEH